MKKIFYPSSQRGHADHGWLKAYHSFSFASWYDPEKIHYGMLRVLNDDTIAAGMGFGTHPHDNMEIITIPLSGSLEHRDSMGNHGVITPGEIQVMSAGSGVQHSEFNHSRYEPCSLLQIWVFPKLRNITPRYDQKRFQPEKNLNKATLVVSPDGEAGSLQVNQDTWFSLIKTDSDTEFNYPLHSENHGVYLFQIEGSGIIEGQTLNKRDAIGISETDSINLKIKKDSFLLLMEIPMK